MFSDNPRYDTGVICDITQSIIPIRHASDREAKNKGKKQKRAIKIAKASRRRNRRTS